MANLGKWSTTTLTPLLTTELNTLTNGSLSAASSAYDNTSNKDIYADFELNLAALSPTAGAYCILFIAEAVDGSNYPAPASGDIAAQSGGVLCSFPMSVTASTAQRLVVRQNMIPPTLFKVYLMNNAGVSLAGSGNTLKMLSYGFNLNA